MFLPFIKNRASPTRPVEVNKADLEPAVRPADLICDHSKQGCGGFNV